MKPFLVELNISVQAKFFTFPSGYGDFGKASLVFHTVLQKWHADG